MTLDELQKLCDDAARSPAISYSDGDMFDWPELILFRNNCRKMVKVMPKLIELWRAAEELIEYIAEPIIEKNPPAIKLRETLAALKDVK